MYQGKFDAQAKGQQAPGETLDEILKQRDAANAAKAARRAGRSGSAAKTASQKPASSTAKAPKKAAQQENLPLPTQTPMAPSKKARMMAEKPGKAEKPAKAGKSAKAEKLAVSENQKAQRAEKRGPRMGGVLFYTFYFLMIFVFFVGVFVGLNWLNGWLKAYEEAQPTVKCQEVFDQLFTNPDWAQLYRLAGQQADGTNKYDTEFENVDAYVSYMNQKVSNSALNFVETSAGLSGDKKYIVRLDNEKIATFTLRGRGEKVTDIPDWKLGTVELFFTRSQSIRIRMLENHVAYINNNALDDSYTIQRSYTKADEMMPSGAKVRTTVQAVSGLLTEPNLVVYDQMGMPISVCYNPDSGMYEEQNEAIVMSEEERSVVFGALESFAGFMINASGSRAALAKYFDGSSTAYADITKMGSELWMNSDRGHDFLNEEILGYTKHSADVFSVRASLRMHVNCKDGTEKDYDVVESMFFHKKNGSWVCYEMTNVDITQPIGEVRLTFCDNSGNVLESKFVNTNTETLTVPMNFAIPDGKVFSGWSRVDTGADGTKTWNIMFRPDEAGNVYLNANYTLEPMTLYPLFEAA